VANVSVASGRKQRIPPPLAHEFGACGTRICDSDTQSILDVCGADTRARHSCGMLALEFPISEVPTNPIGPRPVGLGESTPVRRTHLMLVGTPRMSQRGSAWVKRRADADFDGTGLQRMLTLERLSLG